MYIGYTKEQEGLRRELREYYERLLTPAVRDSLHAEKGCGPVHRQIVRQMGKDGWLGIGWPREVGGHRDGALAAAPFVETLFHAPGGIRLADQPRQAAHELLLALTVLGGVEEALFEEVLADADRELLGRFHARAVEEAHGNPPSRPREGPREARG